MKKRTRDAFLYFAPRGKGDDFAQCRSCMMWNGADGEEPNRCHIHGPNIVVTGDATCGIFVKGPPHKAKLMAATTPHESGLEKREVRCENCNDFRRWGGKARCMFYQQLNEEFPNFFDLDVNIEAEACCNANVPRTRKK